MANIYYLNNPPNPLWDFMGTSLEDHPFFAPRGHHPHPHHHSDHHRRGPFWGWGPSTESEKRSTEKEATSSGSDTETFGHYGRCGGKNKGRGGKGRHGGHGHHHKGFHGPPPGPYGHPGHHGPFGHPFWAAGRGRGPRPHGCRGGRGRHHGGNPRSNAGPQGPGFDFLRGLAEQFGFPINEQAAEGADFTPPVDVFDTPANYIVHVSLPGAKKNDLSIDYDADESVLRLAGVIYRPGMTEDLHEALVMEERARQVGVFEREVRLGSREAPADISVDEILAKLEEGVLVVTLPKIVRQPEPKKKVVVEDGNSLNEKSPAYTSEQASVTMTPTESEDESDEDEGETKEYVKIPVE
ncbi:unnamed protein product [Penicillium pancosmium]